MRPRSVVLASIVAALGLAAMPELAVAAHHPRHDHGLTIAVTPDPIVAGDAVLIYGHLNTTNPGGQTIVLYHRVNPAASFTVVGTTKTTSTGFYEFTRDKNPINGLSVVMTNRNWYVRAVGLPGNVHSRTVHERVAAEVSLTSPTPPSTGFLTNHLVTFTGSVTPHHGHERVLLQEQTGAAGDSWKTVKRGRLDGASQFSIPYRFRLPGDHAMRVFFPSDDRNIAAPSDSVTVVVQQAEVAAFTINTTTPIITAGSSTTITGTLGGLSTPVMVTLFGRGEGQSYAPIASVATGTNGSYSFTVSPPHSIEYQVRTTFAPVRKSAQLFEGVKDEVTINPVPSSGLVGQSVTFTGAVTPNHAGHYIELQRLGTDGHYHAVAAGFVNPSSAYAFTWKFGTPGIKTFRVFVPGGPENAGGYSSSVSVSVSLPPVASLPPAP